MNKEYHFFKQLDQIFNVKGDIICMKRRSLVLLCMILVLILTSCGSGGKYSGEYTQYSYQLIYTDIRNYSAGWENEDLDMHMSINGSSVTFSVGDDSASGKLNSDGTIDWTSGDPLNIMGMDSITLAGTQLKARDDNDDLAVSLYVKNYDSVNFEIMYAFHKDA